MITTLARRVLSQRQMSIARNAAEAAKRVAATRAKLFGADLPDVKLSLDSERPPMI